MLCRLQHHSACLVWWWVSDGLGRHYLEGRTDLYRLDHGPLTAIRYQDEILGPLVRPYAGAVGPGFLLVPNNARPHVARVCRQFLEDEGTDTIDWPTGSPDLNPIEHFWDIMFRSIRRHQAALQTVQELSDALVQIWEEILQDTIRRLIRSGWRPYRLLSTILSCCSGVWVKWTSLLQNLLTLVFRIIQYQTVRYDTLPLSPASRNRLNAVKRKILVLDLDETLIHSHHDGVLRPTVRPGTPPDFILKVSQWYELVVFTASMEIYGSAVADKLDNNRGILKRRYYRQHCTLDLGSYIKDLSVVHSDLSSIVILDNSPGAYRSHPGHHITLAMSTLSNLTPRTAPHPSPAGILAHCYAAAAPAAPVCLAGPSSSPFILSTDNAIPIKSWFSDPSDTALLNLLPMLDALRFTSDVRSVLSRNLHQHRLW
ncbi:hypothetical protein NFI96_000152 [Prochilodus magdalenae]|nr:hypothetical protein NFI96_000152 [Prochilodus magdalenae]